MQHVSKGSPERARRKALLSSAPAAVGPGWRFQGVPQRSPQELLKAQSGVAKGPAKPQAVLWIALEPVSRPKFSKPFISSRFQIFCSDSVRVLTGKRPDLSGAH